MNGSIPTSIEHEDTTRANVAELRNKISGVNKAISGLQMWRAWMLGAIAVVGMALTLAVATVPWMVRSAVQDVLIQHGILRVSKGE